MENKLPEMRTFLFTEENLYDDDYEQIIALTPRALLNCAMSDLKNVVIPEYYCYPVRLNVKEAVDKGIIEDLIKQLKTGPIFLLNILESCGTAEYWKDFIDFFIEENKIEEKFKICYDGNKFKLLILWLIDMKHKNLIELAYLK